MKRVFAISGFVAILLLMVLGTMPAFAQNESVTYVHVNRAVAIPGRILEPGDYQFRVIPSEQFPGFVEVMSKDGGNFLGVIRVFPAIRNDEYLGNEITVAHTREAGLDRIDSFYFPGLETGYRFVYSRGDLHKIDLASATMNRRTASGM